MAESLGLKLCPVDSEWIGWQGGRIFEVDSRHWLPTVFSDPLQKGDLFYTLEKTYTSSGTKLRQVWGVIEEVRMEGYVSNGAVYPEVTRFPEEGYAIAQPDILRGLKRLGFEEAPGSGKFVKWGKGEYQRTGPEVLPKFSYDKEAIPGPSL